MLRIVLVALIGALFSVPGRCASLLEDAHYSVRQGDWNGDGKIDLLVEPKINWMMLALDDDLYIPIPLPPKSPPFILQSSEGQYSLRIVTDQADLRSSVWSASNYTVYYADLLGNGLGAMILQSSSGSVPSFSVGAGVNDRRPFLIQQLTPSALGFDIGQPGVTLNLSDENSDGRSDLSVLHDGVVSQVLLANQDGTFSIGAQSIIATMRAVWGGFSRALLADDQAGALKHFSALSQPAYMGILGDVTATEMKLQLQAVQSINPISIEDGYIVAVLLSDRGGQTYLHQITMVHDSDGWKIDRL